MEATAPQRGQYKSPMYGRFNGGLNVRDFWHTLKDNECSTLKNFRLDEGGVLKKRGGWTKLSSTAVGTANALIGVYQANWTIAGAVTRKIIATDGVTIWHGTGGAWTNITGALVLSVSATAIVSFVMFNNLLIAHDGVNAAWQWDGAAAAATALAGSPPLARMSIVWQDRLWFAGAPTARTRLYYSASSDPTTWGASAYIDVPSTFDGDEITGLAILFGNLFIFKRNSIYILQGDAPENFVLSATNSVVGCVSPYAVVPMENLIYFISDEGLYALNLSNVKNLSDQVRPIYQRAVKNQLLGALDRNRIQGFRYKRRNELWFMVDSTASGQPYHDRIMVHNTSVLTDEGNPAVVEHYLGAVNTAPAVLADYRDPTSGIIAPIASFYDKYVYYYDETALNDADSAGTANFSASFLTGYKDFGDDNLTKTLRNIWTNLAFTGTPKVTISKLSSDLTTVTTATLSPSSPSTFYNTKQPAAQVYGSSPQGKFFAFGFTSDDGGTLNYFQTQFDVIANGRRN